LKVLEGSVFRDFLPAYAETSRKKTPYFAVETAVESKNSRITNALLQLCKQCRPAMKEKTAGFN